MDSTHSSPDPDFQPADVPDTDHRRESEYSDATVLQYNWRSDRSLVPLIVDAVAANSGEQAVIEAPPLHDVIDPDALDSLFTPTRDGADRDGGVVSFDWADHRITLNASGVATVESREVPADER